MLGKKDIREGNNVTVNVGVIGVGMTGQDHIRRLTTVLSGCAAVAVTVADPARARSVADGVPGARAHTTGQNLILYEQSRALREG